MFEGEAGGFQLMIFSLLLSAQNSNPPAP